jgi:opacity protein-like surface antigen
LQLGANYQVGQVVFGAEVTGSLAMLEGSNTCYGGNPDTSVAGLECENRTHAIGTLTGRVGYAAGRSLFYIRGGVALSHDDYTLNTNTTADGSIQTVRSTNVGWTVGGGIEHALTPRWSVNTEYKYIDLGSRTPHFDVPAALIGTGDNAVKSQRHLLMMSVNYIFGGPTN